MATHTARKKRHRQTKIKVDDILRRVDSLPILDPRSADEIIGYDKDGLPAQHGTGVPRPQSVPKGVSVS